MDAQIAAWTQNIRVTNLDSLFSAVSLSVYVLIAAAFLFYVYKKEKPRVLQLLLGSAAVYGVVELIKRIALRPRPDLSDNFSFVSRHTAFAFFLAAFLPAKKEWKFALYAWAALVAFSRLWLNEHWFSDVVFGAGLGIAIAVLAKNKNLKEKLKSIWR